MAARLPLLIFILAICIENAQPLLSYGCALSDGLCEPYEICFPDGLFGECSSGGSPPLALSRPLDAVQSELLRLELTRLAQSGYDWQHARSQCVLAYFKLSIVYELQYDAEFCNVRKPSNVWALLQLVKEKLLEKNIGRVEQPNYVNPPEDSYAEDELRGAAFSLIEKPPLRDEIVLVPDEGSDLDFPLTDEEEEKLNDYVDEILAEREPDLSELSETQRERLSRYVEFLKSTLLNQKDADDLERAERLSGEAEEAIPLTVEDYGNLPLKKDIEHLGNQDTGLDKVEHKIVKGKQPFDKLDSNRVYLKIEQQLNEDQLYQLLDYLEHSIAVPNKLVFDDFVFDGSELSFRVRRSQLYGPRNEKRLSPAEGVAEAVYKRRKDIQTLSGALVDETGIGSGEEAVPVESEQRDVLFKPILLICAFTICALATVLAAHQVIVRRRSRQEAALPNLAEQIDKNSSAAYQELCRHRMSAQETNSGTNSKNSSTSSWSEEPVSHTNMDISTGHVLLTFLHEHLENPSKIEEQWPALQNYYNPNSASSIAELEQNIDKNRNRNCLPYDDTLISIQSSTSDVTQSAYINASAIHDSDPRQANYIATQSPLPNTIANFWQMIWEQGAVLIVNLANNDDLREEFCTRYWPESGSQLHGVYEIHLVSEHIWSEDYLVRSFYLKNLKTSETRTITQFHFLSWPRNGVPSTTKALLEFRRKVNKSYRGRAAPIVVHCSDGIGRTGTYILLDMVLNRISKGVKELNIAGSLEHLRDQRRGMVATVEQYKLVFSCLAEEVTAMVKALPR